MNMHNLELKLENNLLKTWEKQMIKMIKYIIHFISEINIKTQLNKINLCIIIKYRRVLFREFN